MADSHRSPNISPGALALAALASAVATLVIGRFGLAGTVIGAALMPVLIALVSEAARRPARRLTRVRPRRLADGATRDPPLHRRAVRALERREFSWRRVLVTGLGGFVLVVAVFTIADLGLGDSVASDRRTTFFGGGEPSPRKERDERREPATTGESPATTLERQEETTTEEPEETEPTEPTETAPTTETTPTETAPTKTAPTTTSPSP